MVKAGEPLDTELYPYAEAVGALMYLSVCTRPDICHAVAVMARHMMHPTKEHWSLVKGIFQYLSGTREWGLTYGPQGEVAAYADADFAGDPDTRRSTAGLAVVNRGAAISWSSKVLPTVALSTTEAEYMAATNAVREALWLAKFTDVFKLTKEPFLIYGDNQGALKLSKNPIEGARSKHIDVQWHFSRQRVNLGQIRFRFCPTDSMLADCLTKPLPGPAHKANAKGLGLQ